MSLFEKLMWASTRGLLVCFLGGLFLLAGCDPSPTLPERAPPATTLTAGTLPQGPEAGTAHFLNNLQAHYPSQQLKIFGDPSNPSGVLLLLAAEDFRPVLIGHPEVGVSARSAYAAHRLDVLVGSGFVTHPESLTPVGLLKVQDKVLSNKEVHGYTRIIGIREEDAPEAPSRTVSEVVHRDTFDASKYHSALQAGPGVIEDGQLDILERDLQRPKYFRSFFALCDEGWAVGVTLKPSHLYTLGQELLATFEDAAMNCTEVVNLAGDRQAILMAKINQGVAFHGDINSHKATFLGFRRQRASGGAEP